LLTSRGRFVGSAGRRIFNENSLAEIGAGFARNLCGSSCGLGLGYAATTRRFWPVMSKAPLAAFIFLPFETLWSSARAGSLRVGDPAPNFALQTLDKNSTVELAAFKAKRPVVLIFGSYT